MRFRGGEGVGTVTKPGLPIPAGEPAINPVPRQMMQGAIADLAQALGGPEDVEIEISVPDGAQIALKTWNPRLGIEGGISILGTTGVVRPFSCSAWIASIHRGIDVARANALTHVMGSTGATSEGWGRATYELPDIALIDMGDFVGGMLKYMRRHPVPNLSILGGFGKMVKLSQGATDLHSARSQVDFDRLAVLAFGCGMDRARVAGANSVLEVSEMASVPQRSMLADAVAAGALDTAMAQLHGAATRVEVVIIGRDGALLGRAGELCLGQDDDGQADEGSGSCRHGGGARRYRRAEVHGPIRPHRVTRRRDTEPGTAPSPDRQRWFRRGRRACRPLP